MDRRQFLGVLGTSIFCAPPVAEAMFMPQNDGTVHAETLGWRRILSADECIRLYNGGLGLQYPFDKLTRAGSDALTGKRIGS